MKSIYLCFRISRYFQIFFELSHGIRYLWCFSFPKLLLVIDLRNSHMKFSAVCYKNGKEPRDLLKLQMGEIFLRFHHHSFILEIVIKSLETAGLLLSIQFIIWLTFQILFLIAFPFLHRLLESSEAILTRT